MSNKKTNHTDDKIGKITKKTGDDCHLNDDATSYQHNKKTHLQHILRKLPNLPGVYKMLGKNGEILYIGKAKSLKNRVLSYFAKTIEHPKTYALVQRTWDIDLIVVRGETEALLLEQNLIKAYKPPYNVMLRDDKSYLYVYLSADDYPRLMVGRGKGNHKQERFFGPYPSANNAKEALLLIQKMFRIRTCSNAVFKMTKRPCIEYQIKRCSAPCVGLIEQQEYEQDVQSSLQFLQGKSSDVKEVLAQKMQTAAEQMHFEQAAFYRDRLVMINEIWARQAVYKMHGEADVMAIVNDAGLCCVSVLTVRGGQVLGNKNYFVDDVSCAEDKGEQLERFLLYFYREIGDDIPPEILVNVPLQNASIIAGHLGKTTIKHRVKAHKREWLQLANINANNALKSKLGDYYELKNRFLALQHVLGTISKNAIDRIECFDISHTMGEAAFGSCVVFDQGGSRKRDYRLYAIYDITAGDDYAAMRQVLLRRYQKHPLPDLLLIDGGVGQLNIAKAALEELGKLDETLLVSVAKGEGRKAGLEVLHFLHHSPIDLSPDDKALHLIMHIRDEAHRFAITNHRKKRDKARGASVLEVIPGLGAKRRRDLLMHFGGLGQLLGASQEEIAEVKGIGRLLAGTVYRALHQ